MEDLRFLLKLCLHVRVSMEGGESLRASIDRFSNFEHSKNHFKLKEWLSHHEQSDGECRADQLFANNHIQIFLGIMADGLMGHSIFERLKSLEEELIEVCKDAFQRELDRLPYILMVPLLLFMFPAYLLLLLGPILNMFLNQL